MSEISKAQSSSFRNGESIPLSQLALNLIMYLLQITLWDIMSLYSELCAPLLVLISDRAMRTLIC